MTLEEKRHASTADSQKEKGLSNLRLQGKPSASGRMGRAQESVQHAVCVVPPRRMRLPASPLGPKDGVPGLRQQRPCQGHPKQTSKCTPSRKAIILTPLGRLSRAGDLL